MPKCDFNKIALQLYWNHTSSNKSEVIKAVLNLLQDYTLTKKHQKHKNATKLKHKNVNKRTKIKNALKKHLRGKKSLIGVFAFFCFLYAGTKENRK